jgi:anhydro-N-acetylmuramic acid kinase
MPRLPSDSTLFIGLMSGTSLDGVDGVVAAFPENGGHASTNVNILAAAYVPFPAALRADLMDLQTAGDNEIHREALVANVLARCYAESVSRLLAQAKLAPDSVRAIGVHGQTIRHRPESGYTRQINNPALLAELSGIDVVADFRSRDIAAGGQGAPLVPAFHRAVFGSAAETRVVANIGGISNISVLESANDDWIIGFDTGPGNVLMDAWISMHRGQSYDTAGGWAASGNVNPTLLDALRNERFFNLPPPKSTGRDLFHPAWLQAKLAPFASLSPVDVQATLATFTATTLADAIIAYAPAATAVYVCGGGAYNAHLLKELAKALMTAGHPGKIGTTDAFGVSPNQVEALAFAWLAHRHIRREAGNLPSVTGAAGFRILGALYPA